MHSRRTIRTFLLVTMILALAPAGRAQLEPTLVRGPYLQTPTPSSIVVRWRTDVPSPSRVRYGLAPGALDSAVTAADQVTDHELTITGLDPETRYYYAVGTATSELAGGDAEHFFTTAPVPGSRRPVRIWTFGDSGEGTPEQLAVRDAYLAETGARGTDVWLMLGDNAYEAGNDLEYQQKMFDYYQPVLRNTPLWSTFGNHERFSAVSEPVEQGVYYDVFTFPKNGEAGGVASGRESYFSFDFANVHFINLNSDNADRSPGSPMLTWLENDLAANEQEWTIAFFHHLVYSRGGHDSDDGAFIPDTPDSAASIREMRENVLPILEAGGVDLVITAHNHSYERSFLLDGHYGTSDTLTDAMKLDDGDGRLAGDGPYRKTGEIFHDAHSGAVYTVVGTGAEARFVGEHPVMVAAEDVPGSLVVDVDGQRLDGFFVDLDGNRLDEFTLIRGELNLPPIAFDDTAATRPLAPVAVAVLANDKDPDDDLLLVESFTQPAQGTVDDPGDGTLVYTPGPAFAEGTDTFTYVVGDGRGHADTATVTVTVACPPLAEGSFFDDFEPAPEPGWSVDTARNESPLSDTWALVEDAGASSPQHAWFSASDVTTSDKDDRLVSPPFDLTAESRLSFRHRFYFEADFDGGVLEISADGGASWTDLGPWITANPYNGVLLGEPIPGREIWTGQSPGGGETMVEVEADLGAFAGPGRMLRWRLVADLTTPEDTVGWYVDDVALTGLDSGPGRCNLPPQAFDDVAETDADTPVAVAVLANDSDPNDDPLTVVAVETPIGGSAEIQPDQSVLYTPHPGFSGEDRFSYTISDGELEAEADVVITVRDGADGDRVRGNGSIDDPDGDARFALHVRRAGQGGQGWLRFRTDGGIDLDGQIETLSFPAPARAVLEGPCWLADGDPCSYVATAEDRAHPGAGADRFGIEVYDAAGALLYEAEGVVIKGHVKID